MAPAVIDALEMVQVAQNHAKALTGRQCMHLAMLQFILTGMPVQQARQLVAGGLLAQNRLALHLRRDVFGNPYIVADLACAVVQGGNACSA
jgi:hypothetical protein